MTARAVPAHPTLTPPSPGAARTCGPTGGKTPDRSQVRVLLRARSLRYRVYLPIRLGSSRPIRPAIVGELAGDVAAAGEQLLPAPPVKRPERLSLLEQPAGEAHGGDGLPGELLIGGEVLDRLLTEIKGLQRVAAAGPVDAGGQTDVAVEHDSQRVRVDLSPRRGLHLGLVDV